VLAGLVIFQFLVMNRPAVFYPFLASYAYQHYGASLLEVGLLWTLSMVGNHAALLGKPLRQDCKEEAFIMSGEAIAS